MNVPVRFRAGSLERAVTTLRDEPRRFAEGSLREREGTFTIGQTPPLTRPWLAMVLYSLKALSGVKVR